MDAAGQNRLFANLAAIAEDLVSGIDVADLADRVMHSCLDLLDVAFAGLVLDDQQGTLGVLACSSDDVMDLELLEVHEHQGPCYAAFTSAQAVVVADLRTMEGEWPDFVAAGLAHGVVSAAGVPLHLDGQTIGALDLFRTKRRRFSERDLQLARLLCSVATVGVVHDRSERRHAHLAQQLQSALDSRVRVEQAKGIIAARAGVTLTAAFDMLQSAARVSQRPLTELAEDIVTGRLKTSRLVHPAAAGGNPSRRAGRSAGGGGRSGGT